MLKFIYEKAFRDLGSGLVDL